MEHKKYMYIYNIHLPLTTISNMQVALFPAPSTAVYEREVIPSEKSPALVPSPLNVNVTLLELSATVGSVQDTVAKFWPVSMGTDWDDGQPAITGSSVSGIRAI